MRKFLLFLTIIASLISSSYAQDFSNKGSEFYLCFPNHVPNSNAVVNLSIYITSDAASTGNITMANGAFSGTYNLNAGNNYFQEIIIPSSTAEILSSQSNTVTQKSIKVKKNAGQADVVVYAHQFAGARSAATLVLPTSVLGKKYYAFSYSQNGTDFGTNGEHLGRSQFQVIASKPNTVVQVTPKWNGVVQPSFTISLPNSGDIYQYQPVGASASSTDITGTYIESLASGIGGCLPIAVFSGSSALTMNTNICSGGTNSFDPLWQEMYPVSTWGKNFGFIPFQTYTAGNPYRIMAADNNTVVSINAVVVATLNAGEIYPNTYTSAPILLNIPSSITADKPICVAQYAQKANCKGSGGNDGDPDMVILNPIEQNIDDITVFSTGQLAINSRYVNVLLKTIDVPNFKISKNGAPLTTPIAAWQTFTQLPGYSYLQESLNGISTARLVSDSGFNAIAYGFGNFESYAYSAGTNVKDLFTSYGTQSQYAIESGAVCTNSPFQFKISLPFKPDSIYWNLSGILNTPQYGIEKLPTIPNTILVPDSTTFVNGKPKYWYSLPSFYSFTNVGIYPLPVTLFSANSDGCGNIQEKETTLDVSAPPLANFNFISPGCPLDSVKFTDATISTKPNYKWTWNFGDPASGINNTSILENPVHTFIGNGTFPSSFSVTMSTITTAGCFGSVQPTVVTVPNLATATIAGTIAVCPSPTGSQNVVFTGSGGQIPYKFSYTPYVNNVAGASVDVDSDPGLPTKTMSVPTTTAGIYRFVLTNIKNKTLSICTNPITNQEATITVNPIPTATISGTTNVCKNSAPAPVITFTGTGGVSATSIYEFTYILTTNGVPGTAQTINSNTAGVATITVPTSTIGTFKYDLISVKDVGTGCSLTLTASATTTATVFVQDNPTATIATNDVAECVNGTQPIITFTGNSGNGQPLNYKFYYTISTNGVVGAVQNISATSPSNTVTLNVPVLTNAVYIYKLDSVVAISAGATSCVTTIPNASVTVTINPIPSATISGTTIVCQVAGAQSITFTGAGGTRPYKFTYTLNGGAPITVQSDPGVDTKVIPVSSAINVYTFKLIKVEDGTLTACTKVYTPNEPTVVVTVQATSTATITPITTTVCQDVTAPVITFTAANGTAPFEFTYTLTTNGVVSAPLTTTSLVGSFTAPPLTVPMGTTGTLVYTLLSVKNTGPTTCVTPITGQTATVIINPIPTATIGTTTTVCQNSPQVPVTFTGAGATGGAGAAYVFNYTLAVNGGAAVAQTPTAAGNNIIVNQATATPGTYTYTITSVKDNATGCTKTYTSGAPTTTITVKQLATAAITTNAATVCQNSTVLPVITFTATGGQAPYRFKYTITFNGGAPGAVQTTPFTAFGNSLTIIAPTGTAGTYIYTLVSVEESANSCVSAQTGSTQVIVHPQPTASFTTSPLFCAFNKVTFTPASNTVNVTSWVWNYADGTGQQTRTDAVPFDITYVTAGIKAVTFKTVSDKGCESVLYTQNITINSKPKAGFKSPEACLADSYADFADTSKVAGVGASIVYWEWDFGDGSPIYAGNTTGAVNSHKNPRHAYLAVGQKTVKLIVTTNSGCKDTLIQTFFINGEVTSANFLTVGTNYCSNRPVQIKEASVVNVGGLIQVDIYWDNVGAPTVLEQDDVPTLGKIYSHNYPNLQTDVTYKVRYIAYSGFNGVCQKEIVKDILVRASPVATFATVQDVCLNGGLITLNPYGNTPPPGSTGVFMGPGVTFSGGIYTFNPLIAGVTTPANPDTVTYTIISAFSCDSAIKQAFRVLAPPVVTEFKTVGNKCHNNAITFHNEYTNGAGTVTKWIYNWGDGTPNTIIANTNIDVTHVYTTVNTFFPTLTLETGVGCKNVPYQISVVVNPLPAPSYDTTSACLPNALIQFTNTTPNLSANTYNWSFELPSTAAANISTAISPNHIYTTQGPFSTHLIATNTTTGCKDSTAIKVINGTTIHPKPLLAFDPIPDVCLLNGTKDLSLKARETSGMIGGPGIYTCIDVPAAITTLGTFDPLIAGPGIHTIKYSWTSRLGCLDTIKQTVKVLVAPTIDLFETFGNVCNKNKTFFRNSTTSTAGTIVSWIYDWGDGNTPETFTDGSVKSHQYNFANTATGYNVTLYVVTNDGCKSLVKTINVKVNPIPKPDFDYSDTACLPNAKIVFVNRTPPTVNTWAYKWNFEYPSTNLASQSINPNPNFTYTTLPPHSVQLIATSPITGCVDSIVKPILSIHPAPIANFGFSLPSVCIGSSIDVLDSSTWADGAATPKKWEWKWGDNAIAIGQTPAAHTYADAKDYLVNLKITNSFGCVHDTSKSFTVYPFPVVDAGRDSAILEGGQIVLTPTVTGNDLRYKWISVPLPVYLNNDTILNPIATPAVNTRYKLTVTARGGCTASDTVYIKVLKYPIIPNTFSPNRADTRHSYWEIQYLSSYPDNKVQVFTRAGQLVFESRGYKTPWDGSNLSGSALPFDTYYYIIEPGSGRKPITGYVTIVK